MQSFPSHNETGSTDNQLQIVFAVGLLSLFFAVLGSVLLFYFVFMPHDQVWFSCGFLCCDDAPAPEGGVLPSQDPVPQPNLLGPGVPGPAIQSPVVPGPVLPGQPGQFVQKQPGPVNQKWSNSYSKSKGRSTSSKSRKSRKSRKSSKKSGKNISKSKKKVQAKQSSKRSSKKSKKASKSTKTKKKK